MADSVLDRPIEAETIGTLLARNADKYGSDIAIREKELGIWKETSWAEYTEEVLACSAGLEKIGIKPGQAVLILGDNRALLYAGMLALALVGAYAMPAYPGVTLDELRHFVGEVEIVAAFAEDQEQVDKILELRDAEAKGILHIVYVEERGLGFYEADGLMSWEHLTEVGRHYLNEDPKRRGELIHRTKPEDPAVFLHSSGTTGKPKGVVLSQKNVIAAARNGFAAGAFEVGEEVLAYLPMAWVGDYAITVAAALLLRFTVSVPERQETVIRDMREVAPTFYLAAPRSWDNILTTIQVGIENSTPLKKWLYQFFMNRAVAAESRKLAGKGGGVLEPLNRLLGEALIFGPIKDQFGINRLKNAFTGGEAIGEDTFVFYRAIGIKLRQLYGQTENSAINTIQSPSEVRLHSVGKPAPGVEVAIADDGEILLRSESVFEGYYNNPEASAEALKRGWLHTGDAGYLEEDGHLVVLGRVSEVMYTAGGERYVPNYIENRLKFSPYIKDAAVIGAGREELTAMVCIDFDAVGHWAEVNGVPYVSYADLSQRDEVATLLHEAFRRVNAVISEPLQIKRFVSLPKEFDPDDGEITRTRKLRRSVVEARYDVVIGALYDGRSEVRVSAQVTYESGEIGKVERTLPIREVQMDPVFLAELAINGALTGLLYSLFAIGLVLIYKASSVPNLAQGGLTMVGAYVVLALARDVGMPLWLAIPLAIAIMFGLGFGIERVALRRLAGRPVVMILMLTLGLDIFLRGTTLAVWGGTSRSMELGISYEPLFLGDILISRIHLVGSVVAVILLAAFLLFFRTRLGVKLRAIADDYMASWSVGISVERGVGLSWGLASVVAVSAGVIWGEIQGVDQALSLLLLKGLTVAVLGGLDSILGAVVAGIILGVVENVGADFLDPLVGGGSRELIVAAVLILTIMIRPHGLFGRHDIERV